MPDYTKIMRDAAEAIYEEIGERHGYTGLCAGLTAVARELGLDVDRWYWSKEHHDPLSGFHSEFALGRLTFEELIRQWDVMWFGHGTGGLRPLPYPYSELDRVLRSRWKRDLDLGWIERQVDAYRKEKKIRRGTRAHQTFIKENAQRVVDEAARISGIRSRTLAGELQDDAKKAAAHRDRIVQAINQLKLEADLRRRLLEAAGLPGAALTDQEFEHRAAAWARALSQLDGHLRYLEEQARETESPDQVDEDALVALEASPALAAFPAALNLASRHSMRHPRTERTS